MINQGFYRSVPTSLDLNGPILSFVQSPSGVSGSLGSTIQLVGVATATFPNGITSTTGSIAYRWYEGTQALSDGGRLSGTATTTLTLSNLQTSDNSRQFYLEARYNPSAYGSGKNGRAINEPIYSNVIGAGVVLPPAPTATLSASSTSIPYNGSVTLTWSTSGATNLTSNFGTTQLNGSTTISNLTGTTTYSITATNAGGSTTSTVTVNVASPPVPPPPPPTAPTANLSASPSSVAYNGSTTLTWSTSGATSLTSNFGETALSGTKIISNLISTQTYEISATNSGGTTTKQATVTVAAPSPVIRITTQPADSSVNEGTFTSFTVGATVDNPTGATLQYQWYVNGTAVSNTVGSIGGANTPTLQISQSAGNYTVFCRLSYSGATTVDSRTANYIVNRVVVIPTISITTQPSNQTVSINQTATFTVQGAASDGSAVSYQWYNATTGTALSNTSTVSGATTQTLSIVSSVAVTQQVFARVFHPTASNSPIQSNTVTFTVVEPRRIISISGRDDSSTSIGYQNFDLNTSSLTTGSSLEFYAPERDIYVTAILRGGKGDDNGSFKGGNGGETRISFTIIKNREYIIRIPARNNGTGGQAVYLYEKGSLIAVAGGGGSAGRNGNGGAGGGGNSGGQAGGGTGGGAATSSSMQTVGFFCDGNVYCDANQSTSRTGGQASGCPPGDPPCAGAGYWRSNFSPCSGYGVSQARNINGTIVAGSAVIDRGFKGGVGHRNNAGYAQASGDGAGGQGARGGNAAQIVGSGSGGSGGSGYGGSGTTGANSGGPQITIQLA